MVGNSDITHEITALWENRCGNLFNEPKGEKIWKKPIVKFAAAADPFFLRFKELLGEFYWTPGEALTLVSPGAAAKSVIVWCLPASDAARRANRKEDTYPSREWAYTRTYGEAVNDEIRRGVVAYLRQNGFASTAPQLIPANTMKRREGPGWSCNWSERHTAFVAGMGTFGISGGLITEHGIAHRLGSIVTELELEPDDRPYGDDPFAWCLREAKGTCGVCIQRCPVGSIGERAADRNKDLCAQHDFETIPAYGKEAFEWEGEYGCGLCQTGVPCEGRRPL